MAIRPTARDVADESSVSLATVSLVLNGKSGVGEETRRRVLTAMERLGYQRRGQRLVIGLLIERLPVAAFSDPTVGAMIQGVETEVGHQGYHLLLGSVEPGANELPTMVTERQVGGVIVLGGGDISDAYIRTLAASDVPVVLADNAVDGLAVPCVLGDNEAGAYLATRHLLDLGHRRIALLEGPRKYKPLSQRRAGYLRAFDDADLSPDPLLMIKPLHPGPRKGYRQAEALLALPASQQPTAIVAISDKTAFGALEALKDAGLRVPDDVSLVGFDDNPDSAHIVPALTTVRLPTQAIGAIAVQRLVELIAGTDRPPSKTVLYTELVARASSGVARDATGVIAGRKEVVHA